MVGALRLAHALSAATWLGGTLSLLLWGRSHPGTSDARVVTKALQVAIGVLVVSGTILAFSRLSSAALPPLYFGLLGAKVVLGLCMFGVGRSLGTGLVSAKRVNPIGSSFRVTSSQTRARGWMT